MHCICSARPPDEIKKNTHPKNITALVCDQGGAHIPETKKTMADFGAAEAVAKLLGIPCTNPRVNWLVLILANELAEHEPEYGQKEKHGVK